MTTSIRTQYFVAENGYGEEALFIGTGPDDNGCQEVVTRRELTRLSPDLWAVAVTQLTVAGTRRADVNRDRFSQQVRVMFRDPEDPNQIWNHWMTDDAARELAAQLLATVNG